MEEPFSSGKFPFKKAKNDVNSKEVINLMFFLSSSAVYGGRMCEYM